MSISCPLCVYRKLIWLLKLPLDQKSIMIYHKFNGDFKSHINFGWTQDGHGVDMCHYSFKLDLEIEYFSSWTNRCHIISFFIVY